ncbi:MAG: DMT family transporter [Gammaproteobacteria bacterium]|nr:DMT family transporter [Gammaproteobacteria bacterium]
MVIELPARTAGIAWMMVTGLLFVGVTCIVRHLGSDMHPVQAAFIRYAMGIVLLAPMFLRLRAQRTHSVRYGLHALRGVVHGTAVMLWFYAMANIPIAQVTAIGFTAPIFTALGAAWFLGERLHGPRIAAIVMGFVGTLVIIRPGIVEVELGALAQLAAAPLFACSFVVAKKLTETESDVAIVSYMAVFVTLALLPPALLVWRAPSAAELGWLLATATLATAGHYTLTRALRAAELTLLQPFAFLQLVWATLLGAWLFGENPEIWTWIGGAIVVGAATYIAHREARAARAKRPPAGPPA